MKYSIVNGLKVSKICFGCEPLGGFDWGEVSIEFISEAIQVAIDRGVNFFDVADIYGLGMGEVRLSEILGEKRHDVVIATKGGVAWKKSEGESRATTWKDSSPAYLEKAIEGSLKRLKLDTIPLYYIHWPSSNTDIRITFEFLEQQRNKGRIKHIGCSNFSAYDIEKATEVAQVDFVQLPINYLLGHVSQDMLDICRKKDIFIIAYDVLGKGLLTGKYNKDSRFTEEDRRSKLEQFQGEKLNDTLTKVEELRQKGKEFGLETSQYAIRWVLEQERICAAITGIKKVEQIKQNILGV